jgi:two-component system, OmpR family, response regulator
MKRRILVVDDDPKLLEITRELLELEGYLVMTQMSPFGTTRVVLDFEPELILLDVNMPGLSGDRLATILLGARSDAPRRVLLYSSNDEDSLREAATRVGASGYVCKGDGAALRRRIRAILHGSDRG